MVSPAVPSATLAVLLVAATFVAMASAVPSLRQTTVGSAKNLGASFPRPAWLSEESTPWPMPMSVQNGTDTVSISTSLTFSPNISAPLLDKACSRFQAILANATVPSPLSASQQHMLGRFSNGALSSVAVKVGSSSDKLDYDTDASYTLHVTSSDATIEAATIFGAINGMESFVQMVEHTTTGDLQMRGAPWTIVDKPRFSHRGVLIDSSRHFLPLSVIRTMIDAMAAAKLNVLHWHLVDSQSFPFKSQKAPKLVNGAWSSQETYTVEDVSSIVQYAKERGVRAMVEIDTPGHSACWRYGYPEMMTNCPKTLAESEGSLTLDPSKNVTFDILGNLLSELGTIFPDTFFHLGGDEVSYSCWSESQDIAKFMQEKGFGSNYTLLQQYYENQLLQLTKTVLPGKQVVIYQDTFDDGVTLPKDVVLDVWKSSNVFEELAKVVKAGYRAILANGPNGEWYLNDGFGNGDTYILWPYVYSVDPVNKSSGLSPAEEARIIGGEASLWGEEINEHNLIEKAWPRAAAFAERMWSPPDINVVEEAAPRLARMYCRLTSRGIDASPISPGSCYPRD